uniref:Uncharacterized protein n=1 Tax=Globisporangium ultimum (strain ATCC 200006 / CBS 805.95 / DAOM BR144) TaxID=431595 RepID=K3WJY1_GLOUD
MELNDDGGKDDVRLSGDAQDHGVAIGAVDDADAIRPLLLQPPPSPTRPKRPRSPPRPAAQPQGTAQWKIVAATLAFMLLAMHVLFVVLLRKTTFSLEQLTLPDLCHPQSNGAIVLEFNNPSYCSPDVGPLHISLSKNATAFLELTLPRFELLAGKSTVVLNINFNIPTTPELVHALVFSDGGGFEVTGRVPIRISCMLIPFTMHINLKSLSYESPAPPKVNESESTYLPKLKFDVDPPEDQVVVWKSGIDNGVKEELDRLVAQILKTIALSHIHTENEADQIFAYTDVSFDYRSHVLWNLPSLSISVASENNKILRAGFKRFLLGNGKTFISAFTSINRNQTTPLQHMLQKYLGGDDLVLHVHGDNQDTDCFSLKMLDLMDVKVQVPAKINGKPAFLRRSEVHPTLKELDSTTHKCLLELEVLITLNNPLPIHFDLFSMEFDLLYKSTENVVSPWIANSTFLLHVDNRHHIAWTAHAENNVSLSTQVRDFDLCQGVIGLYLHDELAFEIQHGKIAVGAGSGNFTIPFSVAEIHIHPSSSIAAIQSVQ